MWLLGKGSRYCAKLCFTRLKTKVKKQNKSRDVEQHVIQKGCTHKKLPWSVFGKHYLRAHIPQWTLWISLLLHFIYHNYIIIIQFNHNKLNYNYNSIYYNYTLLYVPPILSTHLLLVSPIFMSDPPPLKNILSSSVVLPKRE